MLTQTDDAKRLLMTGGTPAFGGIREVSAALNRSKMGGILSTRELLDIASLLHAANQVRKYGNEQQDNGVHTSLDTMFARINSNRYLEEKINRAIISEEEIADAASSELANIRRQIRQQNVHVRETLNHYVSSATYSKYLQETIIPHSVTADMLFGQERAGAMCRAWYMMFRLPAPRCLLSRHRLSMQITRLKFCRARKK